MKRLRMLVVVAIVLSLLVTASVPVSADKPPKEKAKEQANEKKEKKNPPAAVPEPPGQQKKGTNVELPEGTPEPGDDPGRMVMICHKPGTPAEKTLLLPSSAIPGHLGHGDYLGPCLELSPTPSVTPTETITPTVTVSPTLTPTVTWKIAICHKPDTPAEKTLYLPPSAIQGHLGHGDYLGPCIDLSPTLTPTETATEEPPEEPTEEPTETPTAEAPGAVEVLVCHNPYTPGQETVSLSPSAAAEYLSQGDLAGPCEDLPPQTWPWRLVTLLFHRLMSFLS